MNIGESKVFTPRERGLDNEKINKRILCFSAAVLSALSLMAPSGVRAAPQQTPIEPKVLSNAVANEPIHFDVSRPLTELLREAPAQQGRRQMHATLKPKLHKLTGAQQGQVAGTAGAIQSLIAPLTSATGLAKLLAAAESKPRPFDAILVDDSSRLSRKLADALLFSERLKFAGVRLVFVSQGFDSDSEQSDILMAVHGITCR